MFLTSKLVSCFIDGFTSRMKSQSIAYLLLGSAHIDWILDLEGKCTQVGICSQMAFKNARAMFFLKLGGSGINFRSGQNCHGKVAPARI